MTSRFSAVDLDAAKALAVLAFGNPFLPERIEAERRLAEIAEVEPPRDTVWHRPADLTAENRQLAGLHDAAESLAKRIAESVRRHGLAGISDDLRPTLAAPAMYAAFYRVTPALHDLNERELFGKSVDAAALRTAWRSFREAYRTLLCIDDVPLMPGPASEPAHLFALARQTFAGFRAIFQNLFGGNQAAAALRATVWESCFTRDRLRHATVAWSRIRELPTLILGETGTGKEIVARAIAAGAYRRFDGKRCEFEPRGGFEAVTLAAMPTTLVESELFGHRRGSFTGAAADRPGRLEHVGQCGVAFLDEIGDVDPSVQVKVLRVLQERTFSRIGDSKPRAFDGRIVAATHRDLPKMLSDGTFRHDLYYRLAGDVIRTPPLRDLIGGDEAELRRLTKLASARLLPVDPGPLADDAVRVIGDRLGVDYAWPGNFRELEQCCRSVLIRGDYTPPQPSPSATADDLAEDLREARLTVDDLTTRYCRLAVQKHGNHSAAGRAIGLDRRTVASRTKVVSEPRF